MEDYKQPSTAGQGMGIAALVLGIVGAIAAFIPCFGLVAVIFGVLAIIFGAIGLSQAKREKAPTTMPLAGLVLGIVATAFVIIWVLVVVGTFGSAVMSHKDEIQKAIDSATVESIKVQDSLNAVEITTDTVRVEVTK
ncbi:DUF4190 domain-containing protein [Flavobacterium aquidurense]|jgi:hypothetical protein|uniref:DUF4190 domain-containing protein n=1 Tax=Flavobacterium aquidurense TaxID=362413 RepID=UPI000917A0BB|nr:DUF4190 domain-containing protein [Flavobacterium aquidurense]OXA73378.1 hypothetical protein B0A67_03630 [Flavobacterium aquidurense]SHG26884.1 hypothetical protein SAMN05444481_103170 [Flavobacterium frigidimaris]